MLATFLVVLREAFEAALLLGILYTYLHKIGRPQHGRYVAAGAALGLAGSVAVGVALSHASGTLLDVGPDVVGAGVRLVAVIALTTMTVWMRRHARAIRGKVQRRVDEAEASDRLWLIALVAFVGVFREGAETALFLWGLLTQAAAGTGWGSLAAGTLGVAVAAALAWAVFHGSRRVSLPTFFTATSVLLLLIAAGLLATAVGRLQGIGLLPFGAPLWDTSGILPEEGAVGGLLSGLFGYRAQPTALEAAAYVAYLLVAGLLLFADRFPGRRRRQVLAPASRA